MKKYNLRLNESIVNDKYSFLYIAISEFFDELKHYYKTPQTIEFSNAFDSLYYQSRIDYNALNNMRKTYSNADIFGKDSLFGRIKFNDIKDCVNNSMSSASRNEFKNKIFPLAKKNVIQNYQIPYEYHIIYEIFKIGIKVLEKIHAMQDIDNERTSIEDWKL